VVLRWWRQIGATTVKARDVVDLVPMALLLDSLGFVINERLRRCACFLHGGANPNAFAWTDAGLWRCFSCGRGGNRIALVRAARNCSYQSAIAFLATLAGVSLTKSPEQLPGYVERQAAEIRQREAMALLEIERGCETDAREHLHGLQSLQRTIDIRLRELWLGAPQRWDGEMELAWEVAAFLPGALRRADVAFCLSALATPEMRARFAVFPHQRSSMITSALELGFVANGRGYRFEVLQ
jgi:hypothetical protein